MVDVDPDGTGSEFQTGINIVRYWRSVEVMAILLENFKGIAITLTDNPLMAAAAETNIRKSSLKEQLSKKYFNLHKTGMLLREHRK